MKEIMYRTSGVCARAIYVLLDDQDVIQAVKFDGGCDGNHKGLEALCIGQKASEVAPKLKGLTCGFKNTSCPDQLAKALESKK